MARYKMTAIFDVHEDENRLKMKKLSRDPAYTGNNRKLADRILRPTDKEKDLQSLQHNPLHDDFMPDIAERLHDNGGKFRTTYEITSWEKIQQE
jgi:hypothetical protein